MLAQKEFIGVGAINRLEEIIKERCPKHILLVTGKKSYLSSGAKSRLDKILDHVNTEEFSQFDLNPKLEDVYTGVEFLKKTNADFIVAVGGGSVIDMAKSINILAAQEGNNLSSYIHDSELITKKGVPLVAIPTTSGTGSESTHFAVVYIENAKFSLAHHFVIPDYAIVDPELNYNLPPHITAASGMDALSQAVESYWAVTSTDISKKYASEAIALILGAITDAVAGKKEARVIMSKAAHLAGKAINITTTTAPHALSYPISTYFGLQHGHAVALTLGLFFIINANLDHADIVDVRGGRYLKNTMEELFVMFGANSPLECKNKWYSLMNAIGLESKLNRVGISTEKEIDMIINDINLQRLNNNPIQVDVDELKKTLFT